MWLVADPGPSFPATGTSPPTARSAARVPSQDGLPGHRSLSTLKEVPAAVIEHVADRLGAEVETPPIHSDSTLYRHRTAILDYLGVKPWGAAARELAESTMMTIAEARTDPADQINGAVAALIRHRFELPTLVTLRRTAGAAYSAMNAAQWQRICAELNGSQCAALEALLDVDPKTQESRFAELCRAPGRASRKNLKALIDRYQSLMGLPDPTNASHSIAISISTLLQYRRAKPLNDMLHCLTRACACEQYAISVT